MNISQAEAFPDLHDLVRLFYDRIEDLGEFEHVVRSQMPTCYQTLLAHNHHMTVTVESYHDCLVDVEVLEFRVVNSAYQRKILLRRQTDQRVVMFGIVRLHMQYLADEVSQEILSHSVPLGRVLIEHNVMRRVELGKLWKVMPGDDLVRHFQLDQGRVTFGRTAIIHCDDQPAIELVEIVSPEPSLS